MSTNVRPRSRQRWRAAIAPLIASIVIGFGLPAGASADGLIPTTVTVSVSPQQHVFGDVTQITATMSPAPDEGQIEFTIPGFPSWADAVGPTDTTGTWSGVFARPGTYDIEVQYRGSLLFEESPKVFVTVTIPPGQVPLSVESPEQVGRMDPFDVEVSLGRMPDGGNIEIRRAPNENCDPCAVLGRAVIGTDPTITVEVEGLMPGTNRLRALFLGTGLFAKSHVDFDVDVWDRPTTIDLQIDEGPWLWGQDVPVAVQIDPVPDDWHQVELEILGRPAGMVPINPATGRGSTVLRRAPGEHMVTATLVTTDRWASSADTDSFIVSNAGVDDDPPVGTLVINGGAAVALETYVVVTTQVTDESMIVDRQISCDQVTWDYGGQENGDWAWAFHPDFGCTTDDGFKTVYIRWVDAFGNVGTASDSITLDWAGPRGSAKVQDGAAFTTAPNVTVDAPASDAGSGVARLAISNDGVAWTTFPYSASRTWSVGAGDGLKTVHVRWQDGNDHWSETSTDTIVLDQTLPSGSISIAGGAATTKTAAVTVAVPATDVGSGVSQVALSHDGVAWSVRPFGPNQTVTLPADGTRTVYAKWRDDAGNWSAVKSDSIILDTVAPSATAPRRGFVAGSALAGDAITTRIPWSGADATSGIARYELQHQIDGGTWTTVSTTLVAPTTNRILASERTHRFRVRAVDKAGNIGAWTTGDTFRVSRVSETNAKVKYTGSWPISKATVFLGGQAKAATKVGAKASTTFTGRTIAWVASTGPTRGKAEVLVNGSKVATIDLYSASAVHRKVVWVGSYTTTVSRTVSIRVLGTSGRPRVDLDAFVTAN